MYGGHRDGIVAAMTETAAPPGPATGPHPIYRDPSEGMFAGVCAAVGRYTDTDPVIWRIVTVVLTVFGGAGLVLYLLAWLLIPKVGEGRSIAEAWVNRNHNLSGKALVLIGIVALVLVSGIGDGRGAAAVAVLAVVGYLVYRERQGQALPAPPAPPAVATNAPAWTPPAPRERSRLGGLTLSVAAVVSGVLIWARLAGADGLTPPRITAVALLIVGAGLVVGTWFGRARWLAPIGLVLCLVLAGTAAATANDISLRGGVGQRTWSATVTQTHQDFQLGVGKATLDLTQLPPDGRHVAVTAHVSLGHLIVLVPRDVPIELHAQVRGAGDITQYGESLVSGSEHVDRVLRYGPHEDPRVEVDATVGVGQVEVRRG